MRVSIKSSEVGRCRKRAFTLVELLVVIAIIGLLAAILFPVFSRARENARRTSCVSNLRQLGLGMRMYEGDFDEHMPNVFNTFSGSGQFYYPNGELSNNQALPWYIMIYPYVKSIQVYSCPNVKQLQRYTGRYAVPEATTFFSYSYNYMAPPLGSAACANTYNCGVSLGPANGVGGTTPGAIMGSIENPGGTICLIEGSAYAIRYRAGFLPTQTDMQSTNACTDSNYEALCARPRHLETIGTLFVDSHAKAIPWQRVLAGGNSPTPIPSVLAYWTTASNPLK